MFNIKNTLYFTNSIKTRILIGITNLPVGLSTLSDDRQATEDRQAKKLQYWY